MSKPKKYINEKANIGLRRSQRLSQKLPNKNASELIRHQQKNPANAIGNTYYSMNLFVESDMQTSPEQFPLNQQKGHHVTTKISKRETDFHLPEAGESRCSLISKDDSKGGSNNQVTKQTVSDLAAKKKKTLVTKYTNLVDFNDEKMAGVKKTQPSTTKRALKPLQYYDYAASAKHLNHESLLPAVYPEHFSNITTVSTTQNLYPTPDEDDFDAISTPSLPESLRRDVFTDEIREILNLDEIVYRLTESHVKKLAFILKIDARALFAALDSVFELETGGHEKVDLPLNYVLPKQKELYIPSQESSSAESSIVVATPSPPGRRYFSSQRRTLD